MTLSFRARSPSILILGFPKSIPQSSVSRAPATRDDMEEGFGWNASADGRVRRAAPPSRRCNFHALIAARKAAA